MNIKIKQCLLLIGLLSINILHAQIGINTENPLTLLHIDGKGDNGLTPTSIEFENDVVITQNGDIGIGTITPISKVDIQTNGSNGLKLIDGNQADRKHLVSDSQGFGTWISNMDQKLTWDTNHKFTVPHTGIYLIVLYMTQDGISLPYSNKWVNPPRDSNYDGIALWSETRGNFVISNANVSSSRGAYCSGTLVLNTGEVLTLRALGWRSGAGTPAAYAEIIPR